MKTVLALTILYILIFTTGTIAQQPSTAQLLAAGKCEPFDGQPISCVDIMVGEWSTIWTVPTYGVTQEYLNAQLFKVIAATNTTIVTALEFTNLMPYDCAIGYLRLICTNAFKPCTVPPPDAVGVPPAIPHPICREVCEETNVACAPFWEARNLSAIDCEATNNGVPVYPPSDFNPQLGFFTCMVAPVLNSTPSYECPEGTVLIGPDHVDPNSDLPCAVPCPDKLTLPVDGASNFYRQYVTISVLGWISFVCCNITIVTYLIFAPLRRYPQRIILYAAIGLWVLHLGQVGSSFFGAPDLLCDGEFQWQTATGSWCKFASFCLFWGSMFTAIIWTYLAFIIFWNVALLRVKDKRAQYGEYIILPLAIVYATIESLILLWYPTSEASGGYLSGFPFCGLGPGADRNLFWGILIAPVTFCLLLVVIFTLGAIIKIIITPTGDSVRKALGKRLPAQILLFVFVLSFMTVIVAVIAGQAYGQQYRPAIEQGVENWYACVYAGYIPYDECPTGPTYVSNSIWWYQQIMLGLIGFLFFITFVLLKAEVRNLWVGTFTNCARGEFALASTDIYATTRGVTGGSGKSSGSAH